MSNETPEEYRKRIEAILNDPKTYKNAKRHSESVKHHEESGTKKWWGKKKTKKK